jgi:hypothetical protein
MTTYIKIALGAQALSVLWFMLIEASPNGDPGTALGWVFFQFLITPFVLLALLVVAFRWLWALGAPNG